MDRRFDIGHPPVPFSITNKTVNTRSAEDRSNPFSLLEFIRRVGGFVDTSNITSYYNYYIAEWNKKASSSTADTNQLIVDAYTSFIRDISLNFSSEAENKFFSQIDYTDPYDLDVALSFIGKKIKEIALYYSKKRESIKLESVKHKLAGSQKGLIATIKEKILDVLSNNLDNTQYSSITDTAKTLDVYVDELYQNTADSLNRTPDTLIYDAKDRDYGLDIFLKTNQELTTQIFGGASQEFRDANEVEAIFENKKDLTRKYMGADYFYLSATDVELDTPDVIVNSSFKITYNKQQIINRLIEVTPPPECKCITAKGPLRFTFTKCGEINTTLVTLTANQPYTSCGFSVSSYNISAINIGGICTTKLDCEEPSGNLPELVYYCNSVGLCSKAKPGNPGYYLTMEDCRKNCFMMTPTTPASSGGGGGSGGGSGGPSKKDPREGPVCDCDDVIYEFIEKPLITYDTIEPFGLNDRPPMESRRGCIKEVVIKFTIRIFIGFDCTSFENPIIFSMAREGANNDGPPRGLAQSRIGDRVNGQSVRRPKDPNRPNDLEIVLKIPCKKYKEMVDSGKTLKHIVTITFNRKDGDVHKCPLEIPILLGGMLPEPCCDVPSTSTTSLSSPPVKPTESTTTQSTTTPSLSDCPDCDDTSTTSLSSPPVKPTESTTQSTTTPSLSDCPYCPPNTDFGGKKGKFIPTPTSNVPNAYGKQLILQYKQAIEESTVNYIAPNNNTTTPPLCFNLFD